MDNVSLYSLARWTNGLAFRDIHFSPVGLPVIKIAELKEGISGQTRFTQQLFDERVFVERGDMLFSWSGNPETSIDVFWWRGGDGWLNQHIFKVEPYDCVDRTYFYYLLKYHKPIFTSIARDKQTTGLGHVTIQDLRRLHTSLPSLPEQRAIAAVLGALDDKIELNRRMNATLEAMARALFTSWFVDFDPVRAKMEGRAPFGMDAATAALFPTAFADSPLGPIPAGWHVGTVGDVAELNGWTLGKRDMLDRIEYVEISEVMRGEIHQISTFEPGMEPSRARRRLRHGDTVLSTVRPDRGAYFLSLHPLPSMIASTGFATVTPIDVPWSFLHAALTQPILFERLGRLADGAAYPAVAPEVISAWEFPLPNVPAVLARFHAICGLLYERTQSNRNESRTLADLRDALLPKLLSGAVRVRDAARAVEAT